MNKNNYLDKINFTNDVVFKEVMVKQKELCKELIQRCVPDLKIEEIEIVESEKELAIGLTTKKLRIDAFTSNKETEYAIEMMTYRVKSIEKYGRYHQSMLDANLQIGKSPWELKDTIVIILCTYDPLGLGLPKYTIQSRIDEANEYVYKDGRRVVIVTAVGLQKAPEEIKPIVQLLANKPGNDTFTKQIQSAVENAKMEPEMRRYLMDWELKEQLMKEEFKKEGLEEGLEQGLEIGIEALMKHLHISREEAIKLLEQEKEKKITL